MYKRQIVYEAVRNRFAAQFLPVSESEETKLMIEPEEADCGGVFHAKGKVQLEAGWKKAEEVGAKEVLMPQVKEGELLRMKTPVSYTHLGRLYRQRSQSHE